MRFVANETGAGFAELESCLNACFRTERFVETNDFILSIA